MGFSALTAIAAPPSTTSAAEVNREEHAALRAQLAVVKDNQIRICIALDVDCERAH